jgi:predicted GNAT superfamily acetyltransferase
VSADLVAAAADDAVDSGRRAGVEVRRLERAEDLRAMSAVLGEVWHVENDRGLIGQDVLVALSHAGNYVVGAFDGDQLVGGCLGFFGEPLGRSLHSHVAGVVTAMAGRGVGTAMKQHQRAWCLERGITQITWTYDPLIARNAAFNLSRLGVRVEEYLVEFYGQMDDGRNLGQPSDRLWVVWDLVDRLDGPGSPPDSSVPAVEVLAESADERPVVAPLPAGATCATVRVPRDVEALRVRDPALAEHWRHAVRETMTTLFADGWTVTGFDRANAAYLLSPGLLGNAPGFSGTAPGFLRSSGRFNESKTATTTQKPWREESGG